MDISNDANHNEYCSRMENNILHSTKSLIPKLIKAYPNVNSILDVGCANGKFSAYIARQTGCKILGIDESHRMIQEANVVSKVPISSEEQKNILCGSTQFEWINFKSFTNSIHRNFDCILFSSVMHEISSYDRDLKKRYTTRPIKDAVRNASKLQ